MTAGLRGSRKSLVRELFWTRTGLLLSVLLLVSIACLIGAVMLAPGMPRNLLNAIGTGTMVSAIVGFGQTAITSTAEHRAMLLPVVEESRRALRDLSSEYRELNREFYPTQVFEATTRPDPAFNQLLMRDLQQTRQFFFSGFSARHAAARLLISHAEWELRVIIADPRDGTTVSGRAKYLLRNEDATADYAEVQQRLHEEIRMGLVGLYLARSRCTTLQIAVVVDPRLDRVELFDQSVWITLFSDAVRVGALYPRTLRFSEGSFIYNMERAEFMRIGNSPAVRHFQITPEMSHGDFRELYQQITGAVLSEEDFQELAGDFHAFREDFSAAAELGG
ncbi:hypothetical protein EV191_101874 [Tamaricihabitans halophyticus]|uniref:Uncharacterized protein n=1 Tax=Tamaricihabitans halophyticus TaxID=1262583 RepID=A0A4R2RBX3_9PSEU|nr:hypothetical protein [Tamaricihabitans halophyticus]TCP56925.1 hypothetical protein EV191_101874 [Tamaricihabitans halophyticus]